MRFPVIRGYFLEYGEQTAWVEWVKKWMAVEKNELEILKNSLKDKAEIAMNT